MDGQLLLDYEELMEGDNPAARTNPPGSNADPDPGASPTERLPLPPDSLEKGCKIPDSPSLGILHSETGMESEHGGAVPTGT